MTPEQIATEREITEYEIPRSKKKPRPYQNVKVFEMTQYKTTRIYKAKCVWCDHDKAIWGRYEMELYLNEKLHTVSMYIEHCLKCEMPESASATYKRIGTGQPTVNASLSRIWWGSKYETKLKAIKARLEMAGRAVGSQIAAIDKALKI